MNRIVLRPSFDLLAGQSLAFLGKVSWPFPETLPPNPVQDLHGMNFETLRRRCRAAGITRRDKIKSKATMVAALQEIESRLSPGQPG
ncbi:MAG: hypothetical protein LV481_12615 [Methylacidiphilales bacterium]|nr:hypothetical protein [Candidatus Methylacidiphilales bacterium]